MLQLIGAGEEPRGDRPQIELSVTSGSTYRARLLEKWTMSTNADLIRYVMENALRL